MVIPEKVIEIPVVIPLIKKLSYRKVTPKAKVVEKIPEKVPTP